MESLKEDVKVIEGVKETLEYLSENYRLVVVSNGPLVVAWDKIDKRGCLKLIEKIFVSKMFG